MSDFGDTVVPADHLHMILPDLLQAVDVWDGVTVQAVPASYQLRVRVFGFRVVRLQIEYGHCIFTLVVQTRIKDCI